MTKIRGRKEPFKPLDSFEPMNNSATAVLNEAEQAFTKADLNMAINMLEPDEATIVTLFYLSEQSLDEIAELLNIESNTAKVRLHRARKKLREKLELIG